MPLTPLMKARLRRALVAKRIAVVGATQHEHPVGMGPIYNLLASSYQGEVIPVNPKYDQILGRKCYPDLESVTPPPELAIILLNHQMAVEMTEKAAKLGVQAVVIVTGGFKETGAEGKALEERLKKISFEYEMPVIGPNTLGISSFHEGLHGIFWHLKALCGNVALISQSGGVGLALANNLRNLECGLSHFIGVGNCSVVRFVDFMDAIKADPRVKTFCLFIEGLENPREFYREATSITPHKPIVAYKAGKREEVSASTATHTGALTGEYALYRAMFRQAGIIEAGTAREAAVISKALSMLRPPGGSRLCILTYTAGPAIVAMDRLLEADWVIPDLESGTRQKVLATIGEKTPVLLQNPVDLTGPGFVPHIYTQVLKQLLEEPFDAYLVVWSYNPVVRIPIAELEAFNKETRKPLVFVLLASEPEIRPCLQDLQSRGICTYLTPEDGAVALNALLERRRYLEAIGASR